MPPWAPVQPPTAVGLRDHRSLARLHTRCFVCCGEGLTLIFIGIQRFWDSQRCDDCASPMVLRLSGMTMTWLGVKIQMLQQTRSGRSLGWVPVEHQQQEIRHSP